jgi:hypothetical protein
MEAYRVCVRDSKVCIADASMVQESREHLSSRIYKHEVRWN